MAFGLTMWAAANFSRALSKGFKAGFTVDSNPGVPAVSSSCQAYALVFPGLILSILANLLSTESDSLGLSKVVKHPNCLFHATV